MVNYRSGGHNHGEILHLIAGFVWKNLNEYKGLSCSLMGSCQILVSTFLTKAIALDDQWHMNQEDCIFSFKDPCAMQMEIDVRDDLNQS